MKKTLIILGTTVILIFFAGILRDRIIKTAITVTLTKITGAPVHIDGFSMGVLNGTVKISGFKMYNPAGFSRNVLIDVPVADIHYDFDSIRSSRLHLYSVDLNLKELVLEKNKDGKLSVDSLKVVQENKEKDGRQKRQDKSRQIKIDLLNLQIGRIVSKEYTAAKESSVTVHNINLKKSYKDITSAEQLILLILAEPMKHAGIKGAKIYGVALLTGVGIIPVTVLRQFTAKDSVEQVFEVPFEKLYDISLKVIKDTGKVDKENSPEGAIAANVKGASVYVKLKKLSPSQTRVTVSARKLMLPKPQTADGILYQISEQVK